MESSVVSLVLAQALITMPKITTAELYEKCAGKIGTVTLPQFRPIVAKWLTDGTIPGYEARLGRTGGIYKAGAKNVSIASDVERVKLDSNVVLSALNSALETQQRITAGDLYTLMAPEGLSEAQFRVQLSDLFKDGTLKDFDSRKGPTGGIYRRGSDTEQWVPEVSDDDSEAETSNGFTLQISPTLKVVHTDDRNWTIQKLSGETWQNRGYHPSIGSCIDSVVKHAINGEFKLSKSVVQLKDLASVIKQMEGRLVSQLEKTVQAQA